MLSSFDLPFDISEEMNASVLVKTPLRTKTTPVYLYISKVMPAIKKGDPMTSSLSIKGTSLFKNKNKPKVSDYIIEQNYLTATTNKGSNVDEFDKNTTMLTRYLRAHVYYHSIKTQTILYTLLKNSVVRIQFLNGKLSKLVYRITNDTGAKKELILK